jgi:hypothetical protein
MSVLAFDPGQRNMGVCKHVSTTHTTTLSLEDIFNGSPFVFEQLFLKINAWCDAHEHLLNDINVIAIEKQHVGGIMSRTVRHESHQRRIAGGCAMQSCILQILQTVLQMWAKSHKKTCILVAPRDVKLYFGLKCNGNHAQNKKESVEYVRTHHPEILSGFKGKVDDLCDVFLLQKYVSENAHLHTQI